MKHTTWFLTGMLMCLAVLGTAPAASVEANRDPAPQPPDTTQAGRFDKGKMWTFENPPIDYLQETYGFSPDSAWFKRARLGALRLPGCSAGFVSPNGLVATNHHCARGAVSDVSQPEENLLDNGFLARSLEEERRAQDVYVDQLVAIQDVTDEVEQATAGISSEAEGTEARQAVIAAIERRLAAAQDGTEAYHTEVVSLYNGGRYSAYTFRRYDDVRLVMAPELQLGYYGGDADNFTYPRYALDVSFLRVYDESGVPLQTEHYFPWSQEGVQEGDLVFVIGNPGSTSRLATVEQLAFTRDVQAAAMLAFLNSRIAALRGYLEEAPESGVRNRLFSLMNAQKAYRGRLDALRDSIILARRRDAQRQLQAAIEENAARQAEYGGLLDAIAEVQAQKRTLASGYRAFAQLLNERYASATLRRAMLATVLMAQRTQGAPDDALGQLEDDIRGIGDPPQGLERRYLAAQVEELRGYFEETGTALPTVLQGETARAVAERVLAGSALADKAGTAAALEGPTLRRDDPALQLAEAILPHYAMYVNEVARLDAREAELARQLGRAQFAVYGTSVPPDATFSLRFTDGVVRGYPYNGTVAPPYTTFYGLYNHYYSYGPDSDWALPARWLDPSPSFDRSTPLNFVSTSDTIGGNSGSPVVNRNLELVGLNFDRTIEGLSRDYIYLPGRGRNVSVDSRAVLEALDDIYDMDRLVLELTAGQLVPTEDEADAVLAN